MKTFILLWLFVAVSQVVNVLPASALPAELKSRCEEIFAPSLFVRSAAFEKAAALRESESENGVPAWHQTAVLLRRDSNGHAIRTHTSVVLLHGLYNSPAKMLALAHHFHHDLGLNVVNARLTGHYDTDLELMKHSVRYTRWIADAHKAIALARDLGDEVLLIGHSTGALSLLWAAIENPIGIRGVALFSPAFKVRGLTRAGARFLDVMDLTISTRGGRILTGHAGVEVSQMTKAFQAARAKGALSSLNQIPIWMANTSADFTISVRAAENFIGTLQAPGAADRQIERITLQNFTLHDETATGDNRVLPDLLNSIDTFFNLRP